jgi:hypothetical protein
LVVMVDVGDGLSSNKVGTVISDVGDWHIKRVVDFLADDMTDKLDVLCDWREGTFEELNVMESLLSVSDESGVPRIGLDKWVLKEDGWISVRE